MKRLFLVDAMAMAFRSFYAFGVRPLTTGAGLPVSAVYGSAILLQKLVSEQRPDYLAICTDAQEPTFRHALYPKYKANRTEMPEDLAAQLPHFFRLLGGFGKLLRQPGVEADDLIGSLATRHANAGLEVYIVSGDKDFMQLINDRIFLFRPKKGDEAELVKEEGVHAKFGCRPEQVVDCLALIGDTSDNVPGVHGIGEKGAAKLIETFGSLDGIYANLDKITNKKVKAALEANREMAYLSKELVTIKCDLELPYSLDDLAIDPEHSTCNDELLTLYRELDFKGLTTKLEQRLKARGGQITEVVETLVLERQGATTQQSTTPVAPARAPGETINHENYHLVRDHASLAKLVDALQSAAVFAFDSESTGLDIAGDKPIGLSFSVKRGEGFYLPIHSRHTGAISPEAALNAVRPFLADASKLKVGHNLKFDLQMLRNVGVEVKGPLRDTMLMNYLRDAAGRQHGLDHCCLKHLNYEKVKTSTLIGPKGEISMLEADLEPLSRYACEDADLTLRLYEFLLPKLEEEGLVTVLDDIEMPLVPVLARMEQNGVFIDVSDLRSFSGKLAALEAELEKRIYQAAGTEFNINSPKQLQDILFNQLKVHEQLKVKSIKKTKTGYSTDESVLAKLGGHPLPRAILEYRSVAKLKGTYVDALPELVNGATGRVHTSFHQTGTATGRLSSSEPNLQNIPIRTELGREIRKAFKPKSPEHVIISADYSQIELRLLAHLAEEAALTEAFASGADIHRMTAARVFGVAEDEVDPTLRSRAKAINFGIIYGMGPKRLSAETGCTMQEASSFIEKYFQNYPGIERYIDRAVKNARDKGYSETITGRRRRIDIDGASGRDAAAAENIAVNSPIQGSAADLIKLAMIKIAQRFEDEGLEAEMLLQVHDELVFEAPKSQAERVKAIITDCMRSAMSLSVPLDVQIKDGANWLDAH